jgi:ribulose-phosphate 3-epimerase
MDNVFVPNKTQGESLINQASQEYGFLPWVHLMIQSPLSFYQQLVLPVGSIVSFHIESQVDFFGMIKVVKEKKHQASLAISPKTPLEELMPYVHLVDQVLVMSVEPGFSGQPFLSEVVQKIECLVAYRQEGDCMFRIAVDGGIDKTNIMSLALKGVDDFAVSSGIFAQKDPRTAFCDLRKLVEKAEES